MNGSVLSVVTCRNKPPLTLFISLLEGAFIDQSPPGQPMGFLTQLSAVLVPVFDNSEGLSFINSF